MKVLFVGGSRNGTLTAVSDHLREIRSYSSAPDTPDEMYYVHNIGVEIHLAVLSGMFLSDAISMLLQSFVTKSGMAQRAIDAQQIDVKKLQSIKSEYEFYKHNNITVAAITYAQRFGFSEIDCMQMCIVMLCKQQEEYQMRLGMLPNFQQSISEQLQQPFKG